MAKKKKVAQESSSEEEQQYIVEVITKAKVAKNGKWKYYVKWANYDSDNNTWEPEKNVEECDRLLKAFWADVGYDTEDYPRGHTVYATPTFIAREKAFFAKHFDASNQPQSDANESSESSGGEIPKPLPPLKRKKSGTGTKGAKKKEVGKIRHPRSETPSSSALAKKAKTTKSTKPTAPTRRTQDSDDGTYESDSSASSGVPLTRIKLKPPKRPVTEAESSDGSTSKPLRKKARKVESTQVAANQDKGKGKAGPSADAEENDRAGSLFSGSEGHSSPDVSLALKDRPQAEQNAAKAASAKAASTKSNTPQTAPGKPAPKEPVRQEASAGSKGKSVATGIPTKMRLAETVHSLVPARPPIQRGQLSKLSFKKNVAATGSASNTPVQEKHPSPVALLAPSPASSAAPEGIPSPQQSAPQYSPAPEQRPPVPLPRRTMQPPAAMNAMSDVDQFLSTMMPADMAAPMDETAMEPPIRKPAPIASSSAKPTALGRIPKKWKWTGEAFIEVEEGRAQRLCNLSLWDASDPRPNGLRFSICLNAVDSIRLGKLHEAADIYMILRSCIQVQQFAKLGPGEDSDDDAVVALAAHLRARRAFTYARLSLDGVEVALMLVFPPSINELCRLLKVPPQATIDAPMVAALLPWELSRQEFDDAKWFKPRADVESSVYLDPAVETATRETIARDPAVHRALRILNVPHSLYKFLSSYSRKYCIWYSPADGTVGEPPGMETAALRAVLTALKAMDMGYKSDVRIIFVHVGALKTFHKLPALAERRSKRSEIRFYTYGTHESVPPDRWGIREIYPLGGIVTFTPSAVLNNIVGVYELIKKIDEHPMWECYILPSVIAMLAKLTCQGDTPVALFDKGEFLFSDLLEMIEEGKISLLRSPPLTRCAKGGIDPAAKWISWQTEVLGMDARNLLESSIALAMEQYSGVQENDLPDAIQKEIVRDLMGMQVQPALMDARRRFVVIRSKSDKFLSEDKDGVECKTVGAFDFRDDFFTP